MRNISKPSLDSEKPHFGRRGPRPQGAVESITLPTSDLLSERELARLLGKSLRTIRRWSVERRGPRKVKLGKSVFYRRESVLRWVSEQEEDTLDQSTHRPARFREKQAK